MQFLERHQAAVVPQHIRIGDAAVLALGCGVRSHRVTKQAEQPAAGLVLELPLWRARPAIAVVDPAIAKVESMDHAIAAEPVVVVGWHVLGIGSHPVKRPMQLWRKIALDRKICGVTLDSNWGVVSRQLGVAR